MSDTHWSLVGADRLTLDTAVGSRWCSDAALRCDVRNDARVLYASLGRPIHIVVAGVVVETVPAVS